MATRRRTIVALAVGLAGCVADNGEDEPEDEEDSSVTYAGPTVGDTELRHNYPLVMEDPESEDRVVEIHYHGEGAAEWHFQPLAIEHGQTRLLIMRLYDAEGESLPLGDDEDFAVIPTEYEDDEPSAPVTMMVEDENLSIEGDEPGDIEVRFEVIGPEGETWMTPSLRIVVEE